jgi:hypothetical protein
MDQRPRYAIYFVPARDSALYRFGSAVLQYDCYTGEAVPLPGEFASASDEWRRATEEPRRYGFHATLKAPFYLSTSCTEAQLVSAFGSFAALAPRPPTMPAKVRMMGGFAAVAPVDPDPAVDSLAAACTTIFDAFRAPMTAQERARRLASGLSPSQVQNIDRWGYPYLFADFQFHMTLTGQLAIEQRERVLALLQTAYSRSCNERLVDIDCLTLVKQESDAAPFRVLSQSRLRAG